MGNTWTQLVPPAAPMTEKNVPSLSGRVFIVTGGNVGIGLELVKMLYARGGCTIYIASRTQSRIDAAIADLKATIPAPQDGPPAQLRSLHVDFNDLTTVAKAVQAFTSAESRLDVLWNNAGVAQLPAGSKTAQGFEAHIGINCIGPYLFTKLLTPLLVRTAQTTPSNSVRVIWTSSQIIDSPGPAGGVSLDEQKAGAHPDDPNRRYNASKAGNWLLASELDKRVRAHGVVSITQNPGNIRTKVWDPVPFLPKLILSPFLWDPTHGAYTELWAGLSPDVTTGDGGKYAMPWGGRWHPAAREDILLGLKGKDEGGTGVAAEFWDWCEESSKAFA